MRLSESFHMRGQFPTGTRVYDVADPRHIGRVDAVLNGCYRVTFDNGLRGDIRKNRAMRASEED